MIFILDWPYCNYGSDAPECDGHRCSLGKCIPEDRVCDKKKDCHDGSDEEASLCEEKKKCKPDELTCNDGHCVPKTEFCDGTPKCPDQSDEPPRCTCLEYLK